MPIRVPRPQPRFPHYRQLDAMDCGPTCLRMVARHYGKHFSARTLRERSFQDRQGVSLSNIGRTAETLGFRTRAVKTGWDQLANHAPLPCIAHWNQRHFVVVHRVRGGRVYIADPAEGLRTLSREEFLRGWVSIAGADAGQGVVLLLEPGPAFFEQEDEGVAPRGDFRFLASYLRGNGQFFVQVALGMLVGSLLQLIFPFLTQAIVDNGIAHGDLGFVYVVLVAQLALVFSRTAVEFIRNRILFHLGTRVYVSIVADFLLKLMRLPIAFFDTRMMGDLMQRTQDHHRIQQFLTAATLNVIFSAFTLLVFSTVLGMYDLALLGVFAAGSTVYVGYVLLFLRRRKELDHQRFAALALGQSTLVELITGMQEIKLGNAEQQKRWGWERVQARLFNVNLRGLALDQAQDGGAVFINELKNIAVTFMAAKLVVDGEMTLGMLLAVQYILGQLNAPLLQLMTFAHTAQDARISLERLSEVHGRDDEENPDDKVHFLPADHTVKLSGVSFTYGAPGSAPVLHDLDLTIPAGKVTAVVGPSGSGKTTLLKLLLKFYEPTAGSIVVGDIPLRNLSSPMWRGRCGVVMQDGQLFSDSIAGNVALGEDDPDARRLLDAVEVANVREYVEGLPIAYNTRVGRDGVSMSQGQKQRLLIARAVYKDPSFLLFDEATSSLDANNERVIMEKLEAFFESRTVVVIAHRLSTVRKADQIVVLDGGRIVERGTHEELAALRGSYYELVKNQLELGT